MPSSLFGAPPHAGSLSTMPAVISRLSEVQRTLSGPNSLSCALRIATPGLSRAYAITRFVVVARSGSVPDDANKTSLVFALKSTPGALFRALSCFALRDINLTKLESRPIRGRPWEYMFYADVDIARHSLAYGRAAAQLGEFTEWVRTLGSYKRF